MDDHIGGSMSSRENFTSNKRDLTEDKKGPPPPPDNYHLHLAWLKLTNFGPKAEVDLHSKNLDAPPFNAVFAKFWSNNRLPTPFGLAPFWKTHDPSLKGDLKPKDSSMSQ